MSNERTIKMSTPMSQGIYLVAEGTSTAYDSTISIYYEAENGVTIDIATLEKVFNEDLITMTYHDVGNDEGMHRYCWNSMDPSTELYLFDGVQRLMLPCRDGYIVVEETGSQLGLSLLYQLNSGKVIDLAMIGCPFGDLNTIHTYIFQYTSEGDKTHNYLNYRSEVIAKIQAIEKQNIKEKTKLVVDTPITPIYADVLPDREYPGIALMIYTKEHGEIGAIMDYDPFKQIIWLRVWTPDDPNGDPILFPLTKSKRKD